jgi:hypothetical protein
MIYWLNGNNMDPKDIILQARAKGVPDDVTYQYLQDKGLIGGGQSMLPEAPPPISNIQKEQEISSQLNPGQNFGLGIAKGVGSTVKGIGTLGYKLGTGIGLKPLAGQQILQKGTPQEQALSQTLTPQGTAQNIGYYGEKTAEFFVPSSQVSKSQAGITGAIDTIGATSKLGQFTKGALGVTGRAVPEAVSASAVAGAQSGGDTEAMKEAGMYGGAGSLAFGSLGSAYRGVKNVALGSNETRLLQKALRPTGYLAGKGAEVFKKNLPVAVNEVKATGIPITDLVSLDKATDVALNSAWAKVEAANGTAGNITVDGQQIGRQIFNNYMKNNSKTLLENPKVKEEVANFITPYMYKGLTVPEAQDILTQTNALLKSSYQSTQGVSNISRFNLEKQLNLELADALRTHIDKTLEQVGKGSAKPLRDTYGALAQLSNAVKSRIPKDERLATMSLGQQFNLPVGAGKILGGLKTGSAGMVIEGAGQIAVGQQLKALNKADNLIKRVFGTDKPGAINSRVFGATNKQSAAYKSGQALGNKIKDTPGKQGGYYDPFGFGKEIRRTTDGEIIPSENIKAFFKTSDSMTEFVKKVENSVDGPRLTKKEIERIYEFLIGARSLKNK